MHIDIHSKQFDYLFLALITILGAIFLFMDLSDSMLWQDEAQTALISQTILHDGTPKGYDGINFLSQESGAEYGDNYTYKWHTWLPFYVVAAFFKLFGASTFTARLPFALFGLGCIPLLYILCRKIFLDRKIAILAALLLLYSVPFLILSRQCRYYSMTAFFSLLTVLGYHLLLADNSKKRGPLLYVLGALGLFQSLYLYFATLLGAIACHAILTQRQQWRRIALWTTIAVVINVPWIIWLSTMKYASQYGASAFDVSLIIDRFKEFITEIHTYSFPFYLLLLPGAAILLRRFHRSPKDISNENWQQVIIPVLFILSTLGVLSVFAPAPFFRYLTPLIPFLAMLAALFLQPLSTFHWAVPLVFVMILINRNDLTSYFTELADDYNGPMEGIVEYLEKNAQKNDVVAITYGDMPVKFYTGLRVVGGLTGEDLTPARDADWIIIRYHIISDKDQKVRQFLAQNVNWPNYERIILPYPDAPWQNRESPQDHLYQSPKPEQYPPVIMFHKKSP